MQALDLKLKPIKAFFGPKLASSIAANDRIYIDSRMNRK